MNSNRCRWCRGDMNEYNHSLCKSWYIFLIKDWVDKTEDLLLFMYNFLDELENIE